jgi:hypothetical protein
VTDHAEQLFDFEHRSSVTAGPDEKVKGIVSPGSDSQKRARAETDRLLSSSAM